MSDGREHSTLMYDGFSIIRTVLKRMRLRKMKRCLLTLGKSPTAAKRPPAGDEVPALSRAQVSPGKLSPPRHAPLAFAQPTESATETESRETGNVRAGRPWEIIHVSLPFYRWEHRGPERERGLTKVTDRVRLYLWIFCKYLCILKYNAHWKKCRICQCAAATHTSRYRSAGYAASVTVPTEMTALQTTRATGHFWLFEL